jgi:hypothetical protein
VCLQSKQCHVTVTYLGISVFTDYQHENIFEECVLKTILSDKYCLLGYCTVLFTDILDAPASSTVVLGSKLSKLWDCCLLGIFFNYENCQYIPLKHW